MAMSEYSCPPAQHASQAIDDGFTVISGGVDLAALLAAEAFSLPYTGYVPLHFTNELGPFGIPESFRAALTETSTTESAERTEMNIKDADGILTIPFAEDGSELAQVSKGTQHGIDYAVRLGKKKEQLHFVLLPNQPTSSSRSSAEVQRTLDWVKREKVTRCAIGGPRESESPGIQQASFAFLSDLFEALRRASPRP